MAEVIPDAVDYPIAQADSHSYEGKRQSPGQRPGVETAKQFYYPFPVKVWHDDGDSETIPAITYATVWPDGGTTFDITRSRWRTFTVAGSGGHYICRQEDWAAAVEAFDAIRIEYHTRGGWRRSQVNAGKLTPPIPPAATYPLFGSYFALPFGSNPYIVSTGYSAGTLVIDLFWYAFGAGGSVPHYPVSGDMINGSSASAGYTDGTDWRMTNFAAHAAAGDTWPVGTTYPALGYSAWGDPDSWNNFFVWLRAWHAAVFSVTAQGHSERDLIWDSYPSEVATFLESNDNPWFSAPPFTVPTAIDDHILIRAVIFPPFIPPGTSLVSIAGNFYNSGWFYNADMFLNDVLGPTIPGLPSGAQPPGLLTGVDLTASAGMFNYGVANLLSIHSVAQYAVGGNMEAGSWIKFDFKLDNGTNYAPPPVTDWWNGAPDTTLGAVVLAPNWLKTIPQGIDISMGVGIDGYADVVGDSFMIKAGSYSRAVLRITAQTGIGDIYVNGTLFATHNAMINLWDSHTILRYTVPIRLLNIGGGNVISVQCFSSTGTCQLFATLDLFF